MSEFGLIKGLLVYVVLAALIGCKSTDESSSQVSGSVYYGVGFYDPWYYGGYYDDVDIIVTPPDRPTEPVKPTHPIATPPPVAPTHPIATPPPAPRPTPMPSIPRTPMPRIRMR